MRLLRARKEAGFGLHTALMSTFIAGIGLMLLFMAATLLPRVTALLQTNAIDRTKETVLQSVQSLDIYVDNILSTLHYTSTLLPQSPSEDMGWTGQMDFIKKSSEDISAIAFFAEDGALFYATGGALNATASAVAQSPWFTRALSSQGTATAFSSPHVQSLFGSSRQYVITLSRAVSYTQAGESRTGVLLMDVAYGAFSAVVNSVTLGQSGYVYVIDEHDALVFHPRLQQIYAGLATEPLEAVSEKTLGIAHDTAEGKERVLIIASAGQTRWRVVGAAYIDEILTLQSAIIRTIFIVLACGTLFFFGLATVLTYLVTRPIRDLEQKMRTVIQGDLNATITVSGFREIRSVSSAFNHMLLRIRALMDQIVVEQEKKRLHELNALQAQINPHFLYNTLDSIIWMEERGKGREAIPMVSALARFFRISISKGQSEISVSEELEHVRNYLFIQKMRFKDSFSYEICAQPEAMAERTVKLIVQPLVENCINHAIDQSNTEEIHITINAFTDIDTLYFIISDDGVGISAERLPTLLTTEAGKSGIGLKNVHERIQLTYGSAYGLTIESVEDEYTRITIRLPRHGGEGA